MGDPRAPELLEALAILSRRDGYPSKALHGIICAAQTVVEEAAKRAIARITSGLCTTCWGDGFHRTSTFMVGGPCHDCNGTGRATRPAESDAGVRAISEQGNPAPDDLKPSPNLARDASQ